MAKSFCVKLWLRRGLVVGTYGRVSRWSIPSRIDNAWRNDSARLSRSGCSMFSICDNRIKDSSDLWLCAVELVWDRSECKRGSVSPRPPSCSMIRTRRAAMMSLGFFTEMEYGMEERGTRNDAVENGVESNPATRIYHKKSFHASPVSADLLTCWNLEVTQVST